MCKKCNRTAKEWYDAAKFACFALPISEEDKLNLWASLDMEDGTSKMPGTFVFQHINNGIRLSLPNFWFSRIDEHMFGCYREPGELFDVGLVHSMRKIGRIWSTYVTNEVIQGTSSTYRMSYLDDLHHKRRQMWSWYDFPAIGDLSQVTLCGHCYKLDHEDSNTNYSGHEFTNEKSRFHWGTAYVDEYSVKHNSGYDGDGYCCWRFFASRCDCCKFEVFQMNEPWCDDILERVSKKHPKSRCLACYYFTIVLNDVVATTHECTWPIAKVKVNVVDFNLFSSEKKQNIIIEESDVIANTLYVEARKNWDDHF